MVSSFNRNCVNDLQVPSTSSVPLRNSVLVLFILVATIGASVELLAQDDLAPIQGLEGAVEDLNGTIIPHRGEVSGKPFYLYLVGSYLSVGWVPHLNAWSIQLSRSGYGVHLWNAYGDTATPPSTGWVRTEGTEEWGTPYFGEPKSAQSSNLDLWRYSSIAGTGTADDTFLDATPLLGDNVQTAGTRSLFAIHTIGDPITGSGQFMNAHGNPAPLGYMHVYLFAVDTDIRPELSLLVTHFMAEFNWRELRYEFSIDTTTLEAGYYDVRISLPHGSAEVYRIKLIP